MHMWAILPQFRNFRRLAVMKFLKDLYLDKYGFLASNLNSSEWSSAKKNSFRFKPPPDKLLLQNIDSDWDEFNEDISVSM